ncbi:MAG: ABC transporter substrate-binding protein [Pseudomonadota bacterium]
MTRVFTYLALIAALAAPLANAEERRLVVAGGDLTEIVFALGDGASVVGVDVTSTFPEAATERPQIGYVRRLSAEGVLSLSPDLVIAAHDAGPAIVLEQLTAAGVATATAPQTTDVDGIADKIRFVGETLGRTEEAETLATDFTTSLGDVREKVATLPGKPRVMFVLSVDGGMPLVGGRNTSADQMIREAGALNVAADFEGFKPMSREAIIAAQPEALLMMEQHAQRSGGVTAMLARPEFALTPAGQQNRAITMDGMLMLGFGPRTPEAIAGLAAALQPEAAAAAGL